MFHAASTPQLPQVAFDEATGKCVGYVLSKIADPEEGVEYV